ncbi:MAG TPA: transketolase [Deltaproteobacteria bacterium]|nr:transketolase [Deltaproteobacteria bacterium]
MTSDETVSMNDTINTLRFLAVDAIEKARSGHPGLPLGGAPAGAVLWLNHLRHNPANPRWHNRDRFVLSAGHGSMLLYGLLHLTGYDLSLDDLRAFRTWGSRTPGHPEYGHTPGVEVTTGPLGQGIANAVGMAVAEAFLSARYNRPGYSLVDHHTYVIAGDGDLMEGVSREACSLAGHLRLGKLIVLYDDNKISLAGTTSLCFTEDVKRGFEAAGWQVQQVDDGNDVQALDNAIAAAKAETSRPSFIAVRTIIGYGSPKKQGTFGAHGSPLGKEEVAAAKRRLGWPESPDFYVPDSVRRVTASSRDSGAKAESAWLDLLKRYREAFPGEAAEFERTMEGRLPEGWETALPSFDDRKDTKIATRKASEEVMQALGSVLPELAGGTADLNPSTLAWIKEGGDFQSPETMPAEGVQGSAGGPWGYEGKNIHFGVREHAMAAIASGMALHGGVIPFTGTFFTFSDYMRPSIRLAALMGIRVIYVFSHDSIGVGEDGPTHQPVEQLMSLRCMPNLSVIRPADATETVEAWRLALNRADGPTALVFSRQGLPVLDRSRLEGAEGARRGGYVLWESSAKTPDVIIMGTGSECAAALAAGEALARENIAVRVVSLPSWDIFDRQSRDYRDAVLPPSVKARIAVEAGSVIGWEHYLGSEGIAIGMDSFGASAPADVLYDRFGVTLARIIDETKTLLKKGNPSS